jgi:hypothetical protein
MELRPLQQKRKTHQSQKKTHVESNNNGINQRRTCHHRRFRASGKLVILLSGDINKLGEHRCTPQISFHQSSL